MSWIVVQDGKIGLSTEGLLVPSVNALWSYVGKDREKMLEYIRFVYYMGDTYSPYVNYTDSERLVKIKREQFSYLSQDDFDSIASNELCLHVLEDYKDSIYDILDRGWDAAKKKVDNFLKHLNNIPMVFVESREVELS